jgi:ribulose-phosphate 3-epimerase
MAVIVPTILSVSETDYQEKLLKSEHVSDFIQVDVIDGKFANNVTVGTDVIKKYLSSSILEIHLMVVDPQSFINDLTLVEHVGRVIVPFEAGGAVEEAIYHIRRHNKQVGLAINPQTPVKAVLNFLDDIDLLLLLAVEPGFAGQEFQAGIIDKVREAKKLVPGLAVEVDGGVNFDNTPKLVEAGADFLAANSVLFGAADFYVAYEKLAKLAQRSP